jgi:hypothetical protein
MIIKREITVGPDDVKAIHGQDIMEEVILIEIGNKKLLSFDGYHRFIGMNDFAPRVKMIFSYDDEETATIEENLKTLELERVANEI